MSIKRTKQDLLDILPIGFDLFDNDHNNSEDKGYFAATNNGTVHYNKDYSDFPEPRRKVIIYFNINYSVNGIFAEVRQDGDSRTVYNGIVPNKEFFIDLLSNIR